MEPRRKVVATNAVGVRVDSGTTKVTAEDKFHIGSVTKSMTVTVAAILVEAEKTTNKTWEEIDAHDVV